MWNARIMVTLHLGRGIDMCFWGTVNVLFIGLCSHYIDVFNLEKILQVAHLSFVVFFCIYFVFP